MTQDKKITMTEMGKIIEETFDHVLELKRSKGIEYSTGDDALSNFRLNGEEAGLEMETIWKVYALKHWTSIKDYISDIEKNSPRQRTEPIEGRIDDLIVYLCLLKAMIKERRRCQTTDSTDLFAAISNSSTGSELNPDLPAGASLTSMAYAKG